LRREVYKKCKGKTILGDYQIFYIDSLTYLSEFYHFIFFRHVSIAFQKLETLIFSHTVALGGWCMK
jgi:hypothetical protein